MISRPGRAEGSSITEIRRRENRKHEPEIDARWSLVRELADSAPPIVSPYLRVVPD
jgi:hypothetical protein